jgi:hypothetical protein
MNTRNTNFFHTQNMSSPSFETEKTKRMRRLMVDAPSSSQVDEYQKRRTLLHDHVSKCPRLGQRLVTLVRMQTCLSSPWLEVQSLLQMAKLWGQKHKA